MLTVIALISTTWPALSCNERIYASSSTIVEYDEKSASSSVDLKKGSLLVISLPASLGAGYIWRVSALPKSLLRQAGEPTFMPSSNQSNWFEGREYEKLTFRAEESGFGTLELKYGRPWESYGSGAKTYRVEVTVH